MEVQLMELQDATPVTSTWVAFKREIELNHVYYLHTKEDFDVKNDVRPRFNTIYWWKDGVGIVNAELESSFTPRFSLKGTHEANQKLLF